MSKGGFKAFRGSAATAESYLLERDTDRLDDYYREGNERTVEHGVIGADGVEMGELSAEQFRAWMEHRDPVTDEVRGTFRQRRFINSEGVEEVGGTPLYQETIISVDKTLSLAAAANPRVAAALEQAMSRACQAAAEAVSEHAVTRVGDIGKQRQVKFERMEFTSVQHTTSRTGDPHYHRHMQILPVGFAEGRWRAVDGRTLYRLAERVNAAADLSLSTDMELRQVLAAEGLSWEPAQGGGRITEYSHLVDEHSARRDQVAQNREALELEWRIAHPGQEPGPRQWQAWDTRAWAQERPTKKPDAELTPEGLARTVGEVAPQNVDLTLYGQEASQIDPAVIGAGALDDLGRQRSAWSLADVEAAVDRRLAQTWLISSEGVAELRQAAIDTAMQRSVSFLDAGVNVEGVRHYTSDQVLAVDQQLTDALTARAVVPGEAGTVTVEREGFTLSADQHAAAEAIAGTHELVVIQGAAGAGKTTMLEAAADSLSAQGRRLVVVSPTKRGALEAGDVLGVDSESVHALLYRAGAEVDDTGRWQLPERWRTQPVGWRLDERTVLVVDEAGMLDQDTAAALHQYVDDMRLGSLVLSGDAAQLAAVGRGGYLARAAQLATASLDLTDVRRFRTLDGQVDEGYAGLSLRMRDREDAGQIFDELAARGLIQTGTPDELRARLSETLALEQQAGRSTITVTSTNAAAQQINHAVYERLVDAGIIDPTTITHGRDGDPIAAGAQVATRENDRELGVANRQTWTVRSVNADGRITVADPKTGHHRTLDADYVASHVQLAYAVTGHGAQGMTTDTAHAVLSDEMDAAGVYVGMTRGRTANVLHVVAVDHDDAREQFIDAFARDSADRGLDEARKQVERDMHGIVTGHNATVAAEVDQLTQEAAKADRQAAVWDDAAGQFAKLREQQAAELHQLEQAAEKTQETARTIWADVLAPLTEQARHDGAEIAALRDRATQAQQEARSTGRFSRRRSERDAQSAVTEWEQARDHAEQRWGSAPWGAGEVESWAERVSQQAAGQNPQVRDASKASTGAKIELHTARERHPLEARGLVRQVFRNDPAAHVMTAESGERRATRYAQEWRDRATTARAEVVELRQLPTDQAAERVQTKHQAAAERAAREKQLARERTERLRKEQPHRSPTHQPGPNRGPSLGR
ncbi:relaxase domain-containing protein [Leucobacter sp. cx-42]|uniref:MobF family relaxase n=1 Tax=unclassified Leucobacter TaxID=2621730 RepID=UPI00165D4635|nr:relaxase domain-containing protein [Leucobacter sp. cx-42]